MVGCPIAERAPKSVHRHAGADALDEVKQCAVANAAILIIAGEDVELHSLKFTKARERTPDNREDFEQITIKLVEGEWLHEIKAVTNRRQLSRKQRLANQALTSIIACEGEPVPPAFQLPSGLQCVRVQRFKEELLSRGVADKDGKNPRARLVELIDALKDRHVAAERDGVIWLVEIASGVRSTIS
jgi:hypothetical protein